MKPDVEGNGTKGEFVNMDVTTVFETILSSFVYLAPFAILGFLPLKNHLRFPKSKTLILGAIWFALHVSIACFVRLHGGGTITSLLSLLLALCINLLCFKASIGKLLFTLLLIINYSNFTVLVSDYLTRIIFHGVLLDYYSLQNTMIFAGVLLLTIYPVIWMMVKELRPLYTDIETQEVWNFLWIVPFVFLGIYYYTFFFVNTGVNSLNLSCTMFLILVTLGSGIIYHIMLRFVMQLTKSQRLERENQLLTLQKKQQENQTHFIMESHQIRHDTRQHFRTLYQLSKEKAYDELDAYLMNYIDSFPATIPTQCENAAVDAITKYYMEIAKSRNVPMETKMNLPKQLPVSDSDFCIVLGNLIENAVEACDRMQKDPKFIQVSTRITGKRMLLLTVKNSADKPIQKKQGGLLSSKREGSGTGIVSVENLAVKYNGLANFKYENGIFTASVFLNP